MKSDRDDQNNERQKLLDEKQTLYSDTDQSSRLEWAESSWTRWLHRLSFHWIYPTISTGYKRTITTDDLDSLPSNDKCSVLLSRLQSYDWTTTSLWKILFKEFWKDSMTMVILCIPYIFLRVIQPLLLRQIVISLTTENSSSAMIYILVVFLCSADVIQIALDNQLYFLSCRVATRIRNALMSVMYKQALSLKSLVYEHMSSGQMINLIGSDTSKFEDMLSRSYLLLEAPLEFIIILIVLSWIIGVLPVVIASVILYGSISASILFGQVMEKYHQMKLVCSDRRVHAFNEFIHGRDVIKMSNWEKVIESRIVQARRDETTILERANILPILNSIHFYLLSPLLALATFTTAWLLGHPLYSADVFTILAFFSLMRIQLLYAMPTITNKLRDVKVISKRIEAFMRLKSTNDQHGSFSSEKGRIRMINASFSWHDDQICLSSLNLVIEPGTFVGIIGPVGSGKSSFLAALLGEMNLVNGQFDTNNSSFSYVSQSAWIFADTIRKNIILNQTFDEQRYREVIHACCLDLDLSLFGTTGDLTVVGERGVNLSGGQRARLALARALYHQADVYLIDDPFAAIDSSVAKQIFRRCFSSEGLLKNKTRLLVTHQRHYLKEVQQVIVLSKGQIDEQEEVKEEIISEEDETSKFDPISDESPSTLDTQPIITEERSANEKFNWRIWWRLLTTPPLGLLGFSLLLLFFICTEVFHVSINFWLRRWVKQSPLDQQIHTTFVVVFITLTVGTIIGDIIRSVYYFFILESGANDLHNKMLKGLLRTSMEFFESNPSGRILTRISTDQKVLDETLPEAILSPLKLFFTSIGSIVAISLLAPSILLIVLLWVPFVVLLIRFYWPSQRQLKRLESITRSPIYDLLASSLHGVITVRAFGLEEYFIGMFNDRVEMNTRVRISVPGVMRWFSVRVNLLPLINTFAVAILLVILRDQFDSASIGLCLMYAVSLPRIFQVAMTRLIEGDFYMTSAERIYQYTLLPPEDDDEQKLVNVSDEWPRDGTVEFRDYSFRHRLNLNPVLKNINVRIASGEKIGIIGRTGAGKSSLFKGIFRFVHRSNITGEILIDNIDIHRISLGQLRSHLSIIPQQAILFHDTLRYNLDPLNLYSDQECWMALEGVQLKELVENHPLALLMPIAESGRNLSAGQRQLICIARAILKKSQILLIDEATSNVDQSTDEIIQKVITEKFQDRTVLTIAHRLSTVAQSDRILVLDQGVIVNDDKPENVLQHYQ